VHTEVPADLGVAVPAPLVEVVVGNLVSNACKYLDAREPPRVQVRARADEDVVVLEAEDNGVGIDDADLERLFAPFFRASSAGDRPGHGLGLSTERRIVETYGGSVAVRSQRGQGSVFTLRLPAAPA
jgi:signal transduction histidine kinase